MQTKSFVLCICFPLKRKPNRCCVSVAFYPGSSKLRWTLLRIDLFNHAIPKYDKSYAVYNANIQWINPTQRAYTWLNHDFGLRCDRVAVSSTNRVSVGGFRFPHPFNSCVCELIRRIIESVCTILCVFIWPLTIDWSNSCATVPAAYLLIRFRYAKQVS